MDSSQSGTMLQNSKQHKKADQDHMQQYTTNINELIAQPSMPSTTQVFLSTLFNLSQYLFAKHLKIKRSQSSDSFDDYLGSFSKQIGIYEGTHKKTKQTSHIFNVQMQQSSHQLLECYKKVPYIFFNEKFILDFGQLAKNKIQIRNKQQQLNDQLDVVQINLFSQIHNKFHQYFKVVSNFEYLNHSLQINIQKSKLARKGLKKVQTQFIQKAYGLKLNIIHKQNLQKTIKIVKIIKSLKKLPLVIKQILQSSLPYQCLSLLKSTKQSLNQVNELKCLQKVSQTIKQSQSLVQMGLNKRYTDQLYLYLQQCQNVNLQQTWDRINSNNCVDTSNLNNSLLGASGFLQESILQMYPSTSKNKRNEGKQFEIAMILLQSYKFMNFPMDLIRIKMANSLRVFCKRFDMQLTKCFIKVLQEKKGDAPTKQSEKDKNQKPQTKDTNEDSQFALSEVIEKITVIFYVKHLWSFNQIMKDTIQRFLGYLFTLVTQFNQSKSKDQQRFVALFKDQLSILPAISKIIIDKLKMLMSLKNINGISFAQFKQWISVLQYWKKYTDALIEDNQLICMERDNDAIQEAINQSLKKTIAIFNVNSTIDQLVLQYVSSYHQNVIDSQLEPSFIEQSWQPIQIPSEFVDVLNNINQWNQPFISHNISVTILNDSKQIKNITNKSMSQDYGVAAKKMNKFRVLKSNIMVDGVRYKISVSLLLLCQFIEQYVKMFRGMPDYSKLIFEKILSLIQYYNNRAKELILQAKARQFDKMKAKNISAKHICLVHNCLSVVYKLVREINQNQIKDLKQLTLESIQIHKNQLINKLSFLIKSKVQSTVTSFLANKQQKISQTNLTLLNAFVQMMGIVDEFLDFQQKKAVFKSSIQIFMTKYFKQLLVKVPQYHVQNKMLVQKMRFMRNYFPDELDLMEKEAKARSVYQK